MLDVVVRPVGPRAPTSDTPSRVHLGRGGSGANLAVALARMGHSVTYVGAVGHDSAGATWRDDLVASAVRASLEDVDAPTGVVVALVDEAGQRAMFTDRGANRLLSREFVFRALAGRADHLHVSGYSVLDDATREVAVAALARARERAMTTSVDVCSVGPLETLGAAVLRRGRDDDERHQRRARHDGSGRRGQWNVPGCTPLRRDARRGARGGYAGRRRGRQEPGCGLVVVVGDAVGGRRAHAPDETGDDRDGDQVREHLDDVERDGHLVRGQRVGEVHREPEDH